MKKYLLFFIIFFLLIYLIPSINSQIYVYTTTLFTDNLNSGNYWLNFNYNTVLTTYQYINGYNYFDDKGIMIINSNVTLTQWLISNWINYTVSDSGSQRFYYFNEPTQVIINGISTPKGFGWTYSSGTIIIDSAITTVSINFNSIPEPPPPPPYAEELFVFNPMPSSNMLSTGDFRILLFQYGSIGVQQLPDGYLEMELITPYILNTSAYIVQYIDNGVLGFTSNINGSIDITTNLNSVQVQINDVQTTVTDNSHLFSFNSGDLIKISWRIINATINAYIGLAGIILFCATPILAYVFSDNFREKYKFFMILTVLGLMSVGLILTFIYSGI